MVDKQYSLGFCACDIVSVDLYKSDNYKYASVGIKKGKNQYISISYGWEDEKIPDFILDMAAFFAAPADGMETASVSEEVKVDFDIFMERMLSSRSRV